VDRAPVSADMVVELTDAQREIVERIIHAQYDLNEVVMGAVDRAWVRRRAYVAVSPEVYVDLVWGPSSPGGTLDLHSIEPRVADLPVRRDTHLTGRQIRVRLEVEA
jgi:hypothetical protein